MNETINTINQLRSIRKFSSKEILSKDLELIIKASLCAPNASGRQSYSIIVIDDRETMKEYIGYIGSKVLIFLVDYNRIVETAKYIDKTFLVRDIQDFITGSTDTVLAAQNAAIVAKSIGIDSLFTNSIHRGNLSKFYSYFQIPSKYCFPLISLVLGYPNYEPEYVKSRLSGVGIVHFGKYHQLTKDELGIIVQEYDNMHINKGEEWEKEGFSSYLDWFYTMWCPRFGVKGSPLYHDKLQEVYNTLKNAEFLSSEF